MPSTFLTSLSAAIRMGTAGPPIFQKFLMEREWWTQLGMAGTPLSERPHREVADYELIIAMLRRDENARAAQANRRK